MDEIKELAKEIENDSYKVKKLQLLWKLLKNDILFFDKETQTFSFGEKLTKVAFNMKTTYGMPIQLMSIMFDEWVEKQCRNV